MKPSRVVPEYALATIWWKPSLVLVVSHTQENGADKSVYWRTPSSQNSTDVASGALAVTVLVPDKTAPASGAVSVTGEATELTVSVAMRLCVLYPLAY